MTRLINIVVGNHAGYRGIEDYVHYLNFTFNSLGYSVAESITPRQDVSANIWIEEFSSFHVPTLHPAHNSDRPPDFVVCTEFPSRYRTFNVFDLRDRIIALAAHIFPIRFIARTIFYRTRFISISTILALPLVILGYLVRLSETDTIYRLQLAARFINLKRISTQITGIIVINNALKSYYEKQFPSVPVYVLTPLLPNFPLTERSDAVPFCFFSGQSPTNFRKVWIRRVISAQNRALPINIIGRYALRDDKSTRKEDFIKVINGISQLKNVCVFLGSLSPNQDFPEGVNSSEQTNQYILCEVYIGQTRNWPFASPMREYRALRNGHISISAGHYSGGIFENLVIVAPKEPHDFIKFIQNLDIEQFMKALPDHIVAHNAHYLPLNQAEIRTLLPAHCSTQDKTKAG